MALFLGGLAVATPTSQAQAEPRFSTDNWHLFNDADFVELIDTGVIAVDSTNEGRFVVSEIPSNSSYDPNQPQGYRGVAMLNAALEQEVQSDSLVMVMRGLVPQDGYITYGIQESAKFSAANPDPTSRTLTINGRECAGTVRVLFEYQDNPGQVWQVKDSHDSRTPWLPEWRWHEDLADSGRLVNLYVTLTDPYNCRGVIRVNVSLLAMQLPRYGTSNEDDPAVTGPAMVAWPNPVAAGQLLTVEGFTAQTEWQLLDVMGREVRRGTGPRVPTNDLPSGVYAIVVRDEPRQSAMVSVVR